MRSGVEWSGVENDQGWRGTNPGLRINHLPAQHCLRATPYSSEGSGGPARKTPEGETRENEEKTGGLPGGKQSYRCFVKNSAALVAGPSKHYMIPPGFPIKGENIFKGPTLRGQPLTIATTERTTAY